MLQLVVRTVNTPLVSKGVTTTRFALPATRIVELKSESIAGYPAHLILRSKVSVLSPVVKKIRAFVLLVTSFRDAAHVRHGGRWEDRYRRERVPVREQYRPAGRCFKPRPCRVEVGSFLGVPRGTPDSEPRSVQLSQDSVETLALW